MKFIKNYANRLKRSVFLGGSLGGQRSWKNLYQDLKELDGSSSSSSSNNFEDLIKKGVITEEKLIKAKKTCLYMSRIALFISLLMFFYLVFCVIKCYYMSLAMGFLLFLVTLGLAFKYHFWYMQVARRRLGCTFRDWILFVFKTKSNEIKIDRD